MEAKKLEKIETNSFEILLLDGIKRNVRKKNFSKIPKEELIKIANIINKYVEE